MLKIIEKPNTDDIFKHFEDIFSYFPNYNPVKYKSSYDFRDGVLNEFETLYKFELPVPGLSKKDVNVTVLNNEVTVGYSVEKSEDKTMFISTNFLKTFTTQNGNMENISATVENGVLTIVIPKQVKSEKVIEIK